MLENTVENDFKLRVEKFLERQEFMKHIGFDLSVIEEGRTEGWLDIKQIHKQQKGLVHGGVTATIADIVAGFAAYTTVPMDCHVVTAEIKVSYFKAGTGEKLHAIGTVIKKGRKLNFCEAEIYAVEGDKKSLIAKATTTMAVITPQDINHKMNA
ncbi:PaaI family thioesterase [Marivirga arenosa]|uniref:Medium/long-chain acyl-CoA thioesterase YigI n=1 Tax=Marivirga arenosa TaxID=3059076 RepID=A0AA51ZY09_9BACT|nr:MULTISPECIES: PaaI family thioesterase [unclassified Marivirga]WMN06995.1 PaaI family thioesterase [Marivirga sp. ABR2-2]WNB18823.1 PaaI family thioesterase [Marivirga sp. BKB1-2]